MENDYDEYEEEFDDDDDDDDDLEPDSEGWLSSYSDLVSDLMAVFVLLFSFSMASQSSYVSNLKAGQEMLEDEIVLEEALVEQYREDLVEKIEEYVEDAGLAQDITVIDQGDNIVILRIDDELFFESGSSRVDESALPVLESIAMILEDNLGLIESVTIEGHTDNVPISSGRFETNWELSSDRAVKVLRALLEFYDFDPAKFNASGYGEYHAIGDNTTAEGREKNRRVDFVIRLDRLA